MLHKSLKIWAWIPFSVWTHPKELKTTSFIHKWYALLRDQKLSLPCKSVILTCNTVRRACYSFQREYCWTNGDARGKRMRKRFRKGKNFMSIIGKYRCCQLSKRNRNDTSTEYVSNWCFALPAEQRATFTRLEKQVRTYNLSSFLNFCYWYKQKNSDLSPFCLSAYQVELGNNSREERLR